MTKATHHPTRNYAASQGFASSHSKFGAAVLLPIVLGFGLFKILLAETEGVPSTVLLYFFIFVVGLHQCYVTQRKLGDPKLRLLPDLWTIKFGLTIFLLYVGWIPQLDPATSSEWGYDPQRYYQEAFDILLDEWVFLGGATYTGILYYYAGIFYVFGHNPVAPALLNALITLLATLYLIRVAYELKGHRSTRDWTLAYLLLIPEVLWFDVLTSRETMAAALLIFSTLAAGRYIVRKTDISIVSTLLIVSACLVGVSFVRSSMLFPAVAAIGLIALLLTPEGRFDFFQKVIFIAIGLLLLVASPWLQGYIGGSDAMFGGLAGRLTSFEQNVAADMEWGGQSIGLLLAPNNLWQAILYALPRMVLYLLAPLPKLQFELVALLNGSWASWQGLMTTLGSVLNVLSLPYALAGFAAALRYRRTSPGPLVVHFVFWILFAAIAAGNIIIHERYRVMSLALFYTCAWFGYTSCTRFQIQRFAYPWFGILAVFGGMYSIFKSG
jgi:hypothetical protein